MIYIRFTYEKGAHSIYCSKPLARSLMIFKALHNESSTKCSVVEYIIDLLHASSVVKHWKINSKLSHLDSHACKI